MATPFSDFSACKKQQNTASAIDFRGFASLWCNVNMDFTCINDLNDKSSLFDSLKLCESILTTVWIYKNGDEDRVLDSFQPDEQLKNKKKISYVRRLQDVYKALGPGSEAESATVFTFGSLFTAPYKGSELHNDIHKERSDQRIQSLIGNSEFLPFVPEIPSSFSLCQLRLLDGQFKNHWKATFLSLKKKLQVLKQSGSQLVHIFEMTDLPRADFLREEDGLVKKTAMNLAVAGHGLKMKMDCPHQILPDTLLYIEESVCNCASFGFVGTAGSTIAESIELMRKSAACFKS
uniref:Uncharacterized protein n=1 Tax=Populus trichocarpa TaxID=3694 RepID=A0A2K2BY79_POPTR